MKDLQEGIANSFWWHTIELREGVYTPGRKTLELMRQESINYFDPIDLNGKSVLDIGTWNGGFSFEAKRRGARRVLATDSYVWNQPHLHAYDSIEFVRSATGLDIELLEVDAMDISPESVGTFNVVLFLGVFYHLFNPIKGLQNAAALTDELLIVETAIDLQTLERPAMVFYPGSELAGDSGNWWGPNPAAMHALLGAVGFAHIDVRITGDRAVFHAWKSLSARRDGAFPAQAPTQWDGVGPPSRSMRIRAGLRLVAQGLGLIG